MIDFHHLVHTGSKINGYFQGFLLAGMFASGILKPLAYTVFIRISAQPRISAHLK